MAEVDTAANPQKRPLGDENAGGAIDAQDASKKPRTPAAEAASVELTKEVKEAAKAFLKHADKNASGWKLLEGESAVALVERVAKETKGGYNLISQQVAKAIYDSLPKKHRPRKLNATSVRGALTKHLTSVSAAAFVAAGAPPKKKEEEGHVEGTVDVKLDKGDDVWRRYRDAEAAGLGTPGVSRQQIQEALKRIRANPFDTYAKKRGFEVRDVTDAVRCATATNRVVRGYHRQLIAHADRNWGCDRSHAAEAARDEEERKAKAKLAAQDKETKKADRVIRYAEFGMACSSVPPLPNGATEADRERLQREALEAFYGRSASPS